MKEAKFKIGDRVKMIGHYGIIGEVLNSIYSSRGDEWLYEVRIAGSMDDCTCNENSLELVPEKKDYSMEIKIDIANNVLVATLYESVGGVLKPLAKGHGHLIHEGEVGIAQAASYACNRLWKKIGGIE